MKRNFTPPAAGFGIRIASFAAALVLGTGVLAVVATSMAALGPDAAFASATPVVIEPATIQVVGSRPATTVRGTAAPHVG